MQTHGAFQKGVFIVNPEEYYCTRCGHGLSSKPVADGRRFDEKTGERCYEMVCMNPKCEDGCVNTGGHRKGEFSFLSVLGACPAPCSRCGRYH